MPARQGFLRGGFEEFGGGKKRKWQQVLVIPTYPSERKNCSVFVSILRRVTNSSNSIVNIEHEEIRTMAQAALCQAVMRKFYSWCFKFFFFFRSPVLIHPAEQT